MCSSSYDFEFSLTGWNRDSLLDGIAKFPGYSSFQVGYPKIATRIHTCAHFGGDFWIENFARTNLKTFNCVQGFF